MFSGVEELGFHSWMGSNIEREEKDASNFFSQVGDAFDTSPLSESYFLNNT